MLAVTGCMRAFGSENHREILFLKQKFTLIANLVTESAKKFL